MHERKSNQFVEMRGIRMSIIKVNNLYKKYTDGDRVNNVIENLSFEVSEKEFVAIIGKSGSGKSTLLNMISGLDKADSGEIIINGKNIMELNEKELADFRGKELGFVFQEFNLIPVLSVWDNVVLPVKISKEIIDNEYIENVMKMLEIYDKKDVLPQKLSGGQKQRVAIARALANKPCIIMADEPTGNLDGETGDKVLKLLIDGIRKYNQTLVMVTHDMDIAAKADKILHL